MENLSPEVLRLLYTVKVKKVDLHKNTEILLNAAGKMIKSIDNESVEGDQKMIPPICQQIFYDVESGCV